MVFVLFYFLDFILNTELSLALFLYEFNKIVDYNTYLTLVVSFSFSGKCSVGSRPLDALRSDVSHGTVF
jgi:hypothetical protein